MTTEDAPQDPTPQDAVADGADGADGADAAEAADEAQGSSEAQSEGGASELPAGESDDAKSEDDEVAFAEEEVEVAPEDPLETARAEAARLRDQLLRTAADFDNFRKRTRRDVEEAERRGREELLRDLLPVFDNLERASAHAGKASDVNSLADGIVMVLKQFIDTLSKCGIERVEALGKPFDPAVHEAIQQVATDEFEPGTVANEFQAGYRMGDRLVRPAMVVVATKPPSGD